MSFAISDKKVAVTIEKMEDGKLVQSLLVSNEPSYLKHFSTVFQELWQNGIDALERIKELEEGILCGQHSISFFYALAYYAVWDGQPCFVLLSSQWSKVYLYQIDNDSITLVRLNEPTAANLCQLW